MECGSAGAPTGWTGGTVGIVARSHDPVGFPRAVMARISLLAMVCRPPAARRFRGRARIGGHADRLRALAQRRDRPLPAMPSMMRCPVSRRSRCPIASRAMASANSLGHTDPHSALGMGSFSGFLAARHAMERHGIGGTLVFLANRPRRCASKPIHAAHGYYRDLDAAISFHPHSFPALTNGCFWETSCAPIGAASTPSSARTPRPGRAAPPAS